MGVALRYIDVLKRNRSEYPQHIRWRVVEEEHTNGFVLEDGSCYAIEPDGNICGVCKKVGSKTTGAEILKKAIANGGTKLQAFGKHLYEFYTKNGFTPISWCRFDWNYAPDGCTVAEPLIFYTMGKTDKSFDDFISQTQPEESYKKAYERRDKCQQVDLQ